MGLRDKYNYAIQTAKGFAMQGAAEERDGQLYFKGTVNTQEEATKIWDAIKTIPDGHTEVVTDIKATGATGTTGTAASAASGGASSAHSYTVKSGDTLSKIAQRELGDAGAYMEIFNLNTDQLSDPDKIKPGQVLKIPQRSQK